MPRVVVTGAAGFIGSHLCDRLLADGHEVVGIDSFNDYYDRGIKLGNVEDALANPNFALEEIDLVDANVHAALKGAHMIYHLAGQDGVQPSWGGRFERYVHDNVVATQRLLESVRRAALERIVFASSSSVYGEAEMFPTRENALPRPVSPFGITKLAAEHLVFVYARNFGVPATALRYFTVYGPRQRPDMAFWLFMNALVRGHEIEIFGDGEQTREYTFVSDIVEATIKAATADVAGQVVNLGGGSRVTVNKVLATLEEITGMTARRRMLAATPGDPRHTGPSINVARERLGWEPRVSLRDGLTRQWEWFQAAAAPSARASRK